MNGEFMDRLTSSRIKKMIIIATTLAGTSIFFQNCNTSLNSHSSIVGGLGSASKNESTNSQDGDMESLFAKRMFASSSFATTQPSSAPCYLMGSGLPLVTHYPTSGAKDIPSIYNPSGPQSVLDGDLNVPIYNSQFNYPSVGNYIGDRYSLSNYEPSTVLANGKTAQQTFEELYQRLCSPKISSVKFIQGPIEIFNNGDIAKYITSNAPYFQVLHSIIFRKNLFTVMVPPYWNSSLQNDLPTLMNGFYDLNQNLMELEGQTLFNTLSKTFVESGKTGFGILWNGRGAIASRTFDDEAYQDVNDFLKIYLNDLKASPSKFVTFGESRGAVTAFNLASHPLVTSIKVAFVYSSVPPYEIHTVAKIASVTVPLLFTASDWSIGIYGSWRKSFIHPASIANRPEYSGLNGPQAHAMVITGSYQDADMISKYNLLTPKKIEKLKINQTQIFLSISSHDYIVPSVDQYKLYKDAISNNLDIEVRINYLVGHATDLVSRNSKLLEVMKKLSTSKTSHSHRFVVKHQVKTYMANPDGSLSEFISNRPRLSVELPKYLHSEAEPVVLATGPTNTNYALIFENSNFEKLVHHFKTNESGISISRLDMAKFGVGTFKLLKVYELDSLLKPINKIGYISLNKPSYPIALIGAEGDLTPYIGHPKGIGGVILDGIRGADGNQSYFNSGAQHGSNYGFFQTTSIVTSLTDIEDVKKIFSSAAIAKAQPAQQSAYRFYDSKESRHFVTLNYNEGINAGFKYEGIAFKSFVTAGNIINAVSIYRCYSVTYNRHFVSTQTNCGGSKVEGSMGFIYSHQVPGSVPLYRYVHPIGNDYLVTTVYNEGVSVGYKFETILGYVPVN